MTRHTNRKWVLASLLVVLLLSAMESTVVTTAMKTIVAELGGIEWMSLVFSVYLLVTAVSAPIYGKLGDQYGRRRVLLSAVALFVLGSVLCGLAATVPQLVLFRAVQALGAGAVFPLAMTVVGDLYTTREQTKIQAVVNSVWALSSIVGPLVGGLLAQFADWRWVFFVNVPLGLLSLVLIALAFRETYRPVVRRVDWGGALSFLISVTSLLIVLLIGGERGFRSPAVLVCAALLALSAFAFTALSRRNAEPFLPLELFRNRLLVIVNLYSFLAYAFPIAATMFIPLWVQTVQHQSPVVSGYAVAMATIGWPLGSAAAAALLKRLPPGRIVVPGTGLLALCGGGAGGDPRGGAGAGVPGRHAGGGFQTRPVPVGAHDSDAARRPHPRHRHVDQRPDEHARPGGVRRCIWRRVQRVRARRRERGAGTGRPCGVHRGFRRHGADLAADVPVAGRLQAESVRRRVSGRDAAGAAGGRQKG